MVNRRTEMVGIKDVADKIFGAGDGYVTNKKFRKNEKLDQWENELCRCDQELKTMQKHRNKPIYEILEGLKSVDKKFYRNIEEYTDKYMRSYYNHLESVLEISDIGKNIVFDFIIERFKFLIDSYIIMVPHCKGESDVTTWFAENCNILGLEIDKRGRHVRGIDHICRFGKNLNSMINNREYIPLVNNILNNEQKKIYHRFLELSYAENLSIELEYLSSNFLFHGHPTKYVDMIICYKKDKDLNIPTLELSYESRFN